jgi:transposase
MLGKQDGQTDFFDRYVEERLLTDDHELLAINREVDFSFVEEEVGALYSAENGRPSYPPEQMFRLLFLEYYANLSDLEVVRQVKVNLLYRRFVGLGLEDSVPDASSLSVFRSRLGEERFQRLFAGLVKQCQEKGLLGNRLKALDATHVVADIAIPNLIGLLRDGRRRILTKLEARYGSRDDLKKYAPSSAGHGKYSKEQLADEVEETQALLDHLDAEYAAEDAREERDLLGETIKPGNKRTLASFVDPDARFGHTSARDGFAGYKVHVAQDTTSEVVTSVETLPGNAHEGKATERLLDQEAERNVHHTGVVADAFYDNQQTFTELTKREMTAYIPAKYPKKRASAFTYDAHRDELICPLGKQSIGKVVREDGAIYRFSAKDCGGCSVEGCKQPTKRRAEVYLSEVEKVRRRVPEEEMAWAMEERKKVERRFGQAKRHHGMTRTRYRGRWRMAIQALMTFFVINAKRMVKLLAERARQAAAVPG